MLALWIPAAAAAARASIIATDVWVILDDGVLQTPTVTTPTSASVTTTGATLGGTVAATLFLSGFFNKPPVDPDQQIDAAVAAHGTPLRWAITAVQQRADQPALLQIEAVVLSAGDRPHDKG